jgi:hypothetical protein
MRFTHLPEEVREQIFAWLDRPPLQSEISVPRTRLELSPADRDDSADAEGTQALASDSNPSTLDVAVSPPLMFPAGTDSAPEASTPTPPISVPSRYGVAALVLTIILAAVVGIGILFYVYMREPGESPIHLARRIWGVPHSQPTTPAPPPAPRPDTANSP